VREGRGIGGVGVAKVFQKCCFNELRNKLLKILPVNNKLSIPMCSYWIIGQVCTKVRRLAGCERELSYRIRASPVKDH
jgi:hypothetical protein